MKVSLGVVRDSTYSDPTIHALYELDEETADRYAQAITALQGLARRLSFSLVERNYRLYQASRRYLERLYAAPARGKPDAGGMAIDLLSSLLNWMSSARLFVDHT